MHQATKYIIKLKNETEKKERKQTRKNEYQFIIRGPIKERVTPYVFFFEYKSNSIRGPTTNLLLGVATFRGLTHQQLLGQKRRERKEEKKRTG